MKRGTLVQIELVAGQLTASHSTDGMDEVLMVEIFETILVGIVGVGSMMEVRSGRILHSVLVMSVLRKQLAHMIRSRSCYLHGILPH